MQILRYRDFSDSRTTVEVEEGKRIADVIPVKDWSQYAILINGKKGDENHILKKTDLVIIRSVPHGITAVVIAIAAAVAVGAAIYGGVQAYKAKKEAEKAKKELEKLKNQTNDGVTNVPYLKGASNSVATGKTQPYIIGRHIFTPYILNSGNSSSKGYHTIAGTYGAESYYNVLLEGGFGKQILDSLSTDDIQIASLSSDRPQENTQANPRYFLNENTVFGSELSFVEISQDGQPFENESFNKKIIEEEPRSQLKKSNADDYEDLYFPLQNNSKACDICIMFNGLYYQNDKGEKSARKVTVIPEYSVDYAERVANSDSPENAAWIPFTFKQVVTARHTSTHSGTFTLTWEVINDWLLNESEISDIVKRHKSDWVFQSGEDCREVASSTFKFTYTESEIEEVSCGQGSCTYNITITCSYVEAWEEVETIESNEFNFNKKTQIRFEAHKDFSFSDRFTQSGSGYAHKKHPITVRLRCTTPSVSSGSEVSDCYVEYVHSYCYDVAKSKAAGELIDERILGEREAAKSTLIGVHIKATLSNEEKLGKINIITNGIAPICEYNESTRSYEWDLLNKEPTSNPASWLLEILTSPTHAASRVNTEEIDLASFADLYRHCEENSLSVNLVLTKEQKKADILDSILSVCHASLYQNLYGKCAVAIDCAKENAIAVLNEQNLISFSWEKQISLDVDGVRVTYIDEDSDWQENSFVRLYDPEAEIGEDTIIRDITANGVTNFTQAQRHAHYVMSCDKLRPTKAKAVVGREGLYFAPYEKVLVQHPSLKAGLGNAVIKSVVVNFNDEIIALDLYDAVDISPEESYSMVIQCVSDSYCTPLSLEIDSQRSAMAEKILYLETPLPMSSAVIPHAGDILSYGYRGNITTITREFLIMAIEPNGSEGYALTLTEYNPAIYDCDASTIPEYNPVITQPKTFTNELPKEVPELTASMYQDFKFAVGDFGLSDTEARALDWFDAPPTVSEGKCLYMATKWIKT